MPGRIRRLNAAQVEAILAAEGFEMVSQKGSHRKWRNPISGRKAIVPVHGSRTLPVGTIRAIFAGAEVRDELWRQ